MKPYIDLHYDVKEMHMHVAQYQTQLTMQGSSYKLWHFYIFKYFRIPLTFSRSLQQARCQVVKSSFQHGTTFLQSNVMNTLDGSPSMWLCILLNACHCCCFEFLHSLCYGSGSKKRFSQVSQIVALEQHLSTWQIEHLWWCCTYGVNEKRCENLL